MKKKHLIPASKKLIVKCHIAGTLTQKEISFKKILFSLIFIQLQPILWAGGKDSAWIVRVLILRHKLSLRFWKHCTFMWENPLMRFPSKISAHVPWPGCQDLIQPLWRTKNERLPTMYVFYYLFIFCMCIACLQLDEINLVVVYHPDLPSSVITGGAMSATFLQAIPASWAQLMSFHVPWEV